MAEKPNQQTPTGDGNNPTPQGTQGEPTPNQTPPAGDGTPPEPVDYKKKFSESTTENQRYQAEIERLAQEKAELEAKLASKEASDTLSDEELAEKYPSWDVMSDTEKMTVRNNEEIKRMKEKQAWESDLARAILWAQNNGYSLDSAGFKAFCYKPENIGSKNIIALAKAFVFDQIKPSEPAPSARPGVEPPTGGQAPPDEGVITKEKAEQIRLSNPKLYKKLLLSGRLKGADIKQVAGRVKIFTIRK